MLRYSKELSADILKDFECGIQTMDEFIHGYFGLLAAKAAPLGYAPEALITPPQR